MRYFIRKLRSSNTAVFFPLYGDRITNVVVWTCSNHVQLLLRKLDLARRISGTYMYLVNRSFIFLLSLIVELKGLIFLRKRSSNIAELMSLFLRILFTHDLEYTI